MKPPLVDVFGHSVFDFCIIHETNECRTSKFVFGGISNNCPVNTVCTPYIGTHTYISNHGRGSAITYILRLSQGIGISKLPNRE